MNTIYKKKNKHFKVEEQIEQLKLDILKDLFSVLNIKITSKYDLINIEIERSVLLQEPFYSYTFQYKKNLKKIYHSSKYNCVHSNSEKKQKFPSINLLRQILKSNQLRLHPHYVSYGYDENKHKIVKRFFTIKPLDIQT